MPVLYTLTLTVSERYTSAGEQKQNSASSTCTSALQQLGCRGQQAFNGLPDLIDDARSRRSSVSAISATAVPASGPSLPTFSRIESFIKYSAVSSRCRRSP